MNELAVLINHRDRPTELALLLQSLRTQTYKKFDIYILDDCSGSNPASYHFLVCLMNKMNDEGNFIKMFMNEFPLGVSKSRQKIVDLALQEDYKYFMRVDDDVILENNYVEQLFKVINKGFDLASGVTPFIGSSQFERESRFIQVGNRVILNDKGEYIANFDDFGFLYYDESIIPIHHFRSCALYKSEVHKKVNYLPTNLSKHGFREEQLFSYGLILNGFTMAVNTKAIAWHLLTPSGGERFSDSNELIKFNQEVLEKETKKLYIKNGDFIEAYNKKLGLKLSDLKEELNKNNLVKV